jgi:hypothetical protein
MKWVQDDLLEREPEFLGTLDEPDAEDRLGRELPVTRRGTWRLGERSLLFV